MILDSYLDYSVVLSVIIIMFGLNYRTFLLLL